MKNIKKFEGFFSKKTEDEKIVDDIYDEMVKQYELGNLDDNRESGKSLKSQIGHNLGAPVTMRIFDMNVKVQYGSANPEYHGLPNYIEVDGVRLKVPRSSLKKFLKFFKLIQKGKVEDRVAKDEAEREERSSKLRHKIDTFRDHSMGSSK